MRHSCISLHYRVDIDASIRASQVDTSFQSLTYDIVSSKPLSRFHIDLALFSYLKEYDYVAIVDSTTLLRRNGCTLWSRINPGINPGFSRDIVHWII